MTPWSDVVAFAHRSGLDLARGVADALARRAPRRLAVQASTFFPSPFDQAAVLTLDRGGDFLSTTLQVGAGSRLVRLAQIPDPDSLGKAIRRSPGIWGSSPTPMRARPWGWPYGRDKLAVELADLVKRTPDGLFRVNLAWFSYHREGGWLSRQFLERYGPPRDPEAGWRSTRS